MTRGMTSKIGLASIALAIGCGGSPSSPDSGTITGDGGTSFPPGIPTLTTGTMAMPAAAPADYACRGTSTEPTAGEDIDITMNLLFFGDATPARNVHAWFFPDNVVRDTCDPAVCQDITSSMDTGIAPVSARANGWYAYRVFARPGATPGATVVDSVQYNEPAPAAAGGSIDGNAVSLQTVNLIPAVLGFPRQPGTSLMAGTVIDCEGDLVVGALIRVFSGDTEIAEGPANPDPHYRYFNGDSTPDGEALWTNADGLFAAVNIPVPDDATSQLRIEAWGRPTAADEPIRLGCEAVRVLADAVTIINVGPLRSDYGAGHPCAE